MLNPNVKPDRKQYKDNILIKLNPMPFNDKTKNNNYMKDYMRQRRAKNKWELNMNLVLNQFKQRVILPKHIYEFKQILKQMLLVHFKRSFIIKRNRTDLIVQSWNFSRNYLKFCEI